MFQSSVGATWGAGQTGGGSTPSHARERGARHPRAAARVFAICRTLSYALQAPSTTCPTSYTVRIFAAGTKYTTSYYKSGATCVANAPQTTYAFYAAGAEIPPASFQAATVVTE